MPADCIYDNCDDTSDRHDDAFHNLDGLSDRLGVCSPNCVVCLLDIPETHGWNRGIGTTQTQFLLWLLVYVPGGEIKCQSLVILNEDGCRKGSIGWGLLPSYN